MRWYHWMTAMALAAFVAAMGVTACSDDDDDDDDSGDDDDDDSGGSLSAAQCSEACDKALSCVESLVPDSLRDYFLDECRSECESTGTQTEYECVMNNDCGEILSSDDPCGLGLEELL